MNWHIIDILDPARFWPLVGGVVLIFLVLVLMLRSESKSAERAHDVITALGKLDPKLVEAFEIRGIYGESGYIDYDKVLRLRAVQKGKTERIAGQTELAEALEILSRDTKKKEKN